MLRLVVFLYFLQIIGSSSGCFSTVEVSTDQKEIGLPIDENNQAIGNLIAIQPKKVCLIDAGYTDEIFVCYNNGNCEVKIVLANLTHYYRVPYCLCQEGYSGDNCREDNRFLLTLSVHAVNDLLNKHFTLVLFSCAVVFFLVIIIVFYHLRTKMNESKRETENAETNNLKLLENKIDSS